MDNFKRLSFGFAATVFLFGCKSVKTLVNNEFPPLSTTTQQYVSVERNLAAMQDFSAHVGLHIDKDLIAEYVPAEIKNRVRAMEDENVVIEHIEPKLSFDKQGIFIDADFSIAIPKQHVKLEGSLSGVTAVSTSTDSVYLRSALSSLKISSVKFTKKASLTKQALAKLIVPVLRNYIENINGAILKKPTAIYAGWGETYKKELRELFRDPNIEIVAEPVSATRFVNKSSVRIASDGVSVMVELARDKPGIEVVAPASSQSRTRPELSRLFNKFDEQFDTRWLAVFEKIDDKAGMTVNVSKAEVSKILNEGLSKPVTLKQRFVIPGSDFNQKLEVKRGDIDCQRVRTDFKYPDFNGDNCNWNCMRRVTVGICPACTRIWVEEPLCAASRRACRLRVETERIAWQAARETARIAHQVENEARVAACNVQREAADFMALGRFKGSVSGDGRATVDFKSFQFKDDLSEISLRFEGKVNAELKSKLELNPVDLGHIFFCYTNYDKRFTSGINVDIPQATSKININSSREGENLTLHVKLDKVKYDATISPSPLHMLLIDPQFVAQCPISTLIGLGAGAAGVAKLLDMVKLAPEQELMLMGSVKGEYGAGEMEVTFEPLTFKINGDPKKAVLFWNDKSIQSKYLKRPQAQQQPDGALEASIRP